MKRRAIRQRGNAIVMLFAAIGMAGVVTYGLNNVMRGPAVATSEISRKTIAENNMVAASRLAISGAVRNQPNGGDCDRDGFVEAVPFRDPQLLPAPVGGGLLPMTIGASLTDPWGNQYGYCVWDPGTLSVSDNVSACGAPTAARLQGSAKDNQPAIAILSAGKNGVFETSCTAFLDVSPADGIPDIKMIDRPVESDDLLLSHTYAEANGIGAGEWSIKAGDPATAQIAKDLSIEGGADFSGALHASGGFILPQSAGADDVTGPCDQSKDQQMRINNATSPPSLEICNFTGGGWATVSATSTGPTYPSCVFSAATLSGKLAASSMGRSVTVGSRLLAGTRSGGSDCSLFSINTANPSMMGIAQTANNCTGARAPDDLAVSGNLLYAVSDSDDALSVWDIADPSAMVYRGRVVSGTAMNSPQAIAPLGATAAVVASYDSDSIAVIDISNPAAPAITGGGTGYLSSAAYMNGARDVDVVDTYAYVVGKLSNSLAVINIANPAAPALAGNLVDGTNLDSPDFIKVYNNHAFVMSADVSKKYLTVINISNSAAPAFVTAINDGRTDAVRDVKLYGKYLFAVSANGINIFDIGNPAAPLLAKSFAADLVGTDPEGISLYRNYALVTERDTAASFNGVKAINIGCDPLTGDVDRSLVTEDTPPPALDRLDTALVAHWPLDEGTGTAITDPVGGSTGTFINTPTWVQGVTGTSALNFNAADRDAVSVSTATNWGSGTGKSISMWANIRRAGDSMLFALGNGAFIESWPNEGIRFRLRSGSTDYIAVTSENIIGTGWHYITATYDPANERQTIYVDGIMTDHKTTTQAISYDTTAMIGRNTLNAAHDFDGAIDDIRVHGVALSPGEVAELYRRMKEQSTVRKESSISASNNFGQPKIAIGSGYVCGIKRDKSLWCWGNNLSGSLGTGNVQDQAIPVRVGWHSYVSIAAGGTSTCGIRTDGSLWCWGNNTSGQLGIGPITGKYPVPQKVHNGPVSQVSTAGTHTCAILGNSDLYCWGADNAGQLGNGATTTTTQGLPVQVAGSWSYVDTGNSHTCGIKTDGTAWCWGSDSAGQLGNDSASGNQASPVEVAFHGKGPWVNISAGLSSTCGVKQDGSAWCWGANGSKQLGTLSSASSQDSPVKVSGMMRKFSFISVGAMHACALLADSSAWCWGSDSVGQLGNGATIIADQSVASRLLGVNSWNALAAESANTCGLRADDTLWCVGNNTNGQLADSSILNNTPNPVIVPGWVQKPALGWNDAQDIIVANPGTPIGLFQSLIANQTGANNGLGFSSPGRAYLSQLTTGNQLLIETGLASAAAQLSFRTSDAAATDVTSGLVARWALDDSSGTTTSSNPGSYTATLQNGPAWMPSYGRIGGAIYLDGTDDSLRVSRSAAIEPAAITVSAWVYADGLQDSYAKILSKTHTNQTSPTYQSYALQIGESGSGFAFATGHAAGRRGLQSATVPLNRWIHVAGTYDPAGAAPQKRIYVNGTLSGYETRTDALIYDATSTGDFYIGVNGAGGDNFKGAIDDVRIYNRALTPSEVQQLYAQTGSGQITRSMGIDPTADGPGGLFKIGKNNAAASNWMNSVTPELAVNSAGAVGIGTATPQAAVDVAGGVKLGADYICDSAAHAGKLRYLHGAATPWQYCNGTAWTDLPDAAAAPALGWSTSYYAFSAGNNNTCGIKADGTAWCWGQATNGKLGNNTTTPNVDVPVQVHSDSSATGWTDWAQIAVDQNHACGIRSNGTAWCWGMQTGGKLGNGSTSSANILRPVQVQTDTGPGGWSDWVLIAVKRANTCGLRANGTAWCWGEGTYGFNGDGTTNATARPVQVHTDTGPGGWSDWIDLSVGRFHVCGIRVNGTAWCWGQSATGILGNGTDPATTSRPAQVQTDTGPGAWSDWVRISANGGNSCGIRSDGTAWCWGGSSQGRLGNGTTTPNMNRPVQVQTDTGPGGWNDWTSIYVGPNDTCGIRANGTAWCWGYNNQGQQGNNSTTQHTRPTQILSDTGGAGWNDWALVTLGSNFTTCGVRNNGTAWCWGNNTNGTLGNGTSGAGTETLIPVQVQ